MSARWARMGWWGMAAMATLLIMGRRAHPQPAQPQSGQTQSGQTQSGQGQPGQAQPGQVQKPGGVPAQNPAVRTEHTPPRRPEQMKGVPSPEMPPGAPECGGIAPQKTAEDVLAEMVKSAGVIFVGQVYAIRMPEGEANPGTSGGLHSSQPHVVEIEFRVDQGVRETSIGDPFVLREAEDQWRKGPQFTPHERAIVFLCPPDKDGLSAPVGGAVGVIPRGDDNQVDLTRLHALVEGAPANPAAANGSSDEGSGGQGTAQAAGEATGEAPLAMETSGGRMPELDAARAPFLAVLRDIYMLAAAEQPAGAAKSGF
jgi:hypothetical protein